MSPLVMESHRMTAANLWKFRAISTLLNCIAAWSPLLAAPPTNAGPNTFPQAISLADVNFTQTISLCDGEPIEADKAQVGYALGLIEQGQAWRVSPLAGSERQAHG